MTAAPRAPGADGLEVAIARSLAGLPVDPATLPPRARRALALARELGAPRAPALRAAAAAAADLEELHAAVAVASAEGRSVARALVLAPPLVGPAAALLVSDAPFAVWGTAAGRVVLLVAGLCWLAGWAAVRALVAGATRPAPDGQGPSEELLDLTAVGLAAGLDLPASLRAAARACGADQHVAALWLELGARGAPPAGWEQAGPVLAAARHDGVAMVGVLRGLAAARRRLAHRTALERAARLGARLTLPTTLLLLPAALLVVAAPLLHGALGLVT